jgi:hypothetical protein
MQTKQKGQSEYTNKVYFSNKSTLLSKNENENNK